MNGILIVWSMAASASLTLAGMHLIVWLKSRAAHTHLLFVLTAASAAGMAFFELKMMWAQTPEEFSRAVRWLHVPVWVFILSLTVFVLLHLRAGRRWLAWTVWIVRTGSLAVNFLADQNLNFSEITALRHVRFLGESIPMPQGVVNPWMLLGSFGMLLFLIFVVDAAVTVWRRGDRRLALTTGGSIVLCVLAGTIQSRLFVWQAAEWPYMGSLFFMAIVAAMSYEMGREIVAAAQTAEQLRRSEAGLREAEQRMDDAADAAEIGSWQWDIQRDEIWATDRCRDLFGIPRDQRLDFEGVVGVVHPDDRTALRAAVKHSLEQRAALEWEYRVVLPDGGWRWILTRGRVEPETSGNPALVHGVSINITRRKQLEVRFQQVVRVAPIGMMILRPTGTIDLVNSWIETTFGYPQHELIGHPIQAVIPHWECTREGCACSCLSDSTAARSVADRQAIGVRKDGTEVPLEISTDTIQALDGSAAETLVTMIDISERKRSQRFLNQERAFLRQVIDIDPNLIFAKDRQGRFTLANQAVADIYGTTVQDLIGKTDADFNSNREQVEYFRRIDLEVMDSLQERIVPEEQITDAGGRIRYLQTVKRPIVGPDSTVHQLLGTATDITARKLAEESIRHSEEFNRSVLASLQDHVVILDRNGTVIAVNDAWREFGMPDGAPTSMGDAAIGCNYLEICTYATTPGDATGQRAKDGIGAVLSGQSNFFSIEYSPNWPSGSGWILMRVMPLKRMEGGVVISHRDITERKEAELELLQQRNELAHFSRVTMLGQLSGALAHELNQPLAAILSNAQAALRFLADDDYDRNEVREILRDIVNDDKRAGDVIQGLRLLLKKGETRHEPLDLNDLVQDVFRLMRSEILNARVALTMQLGADLPIVMGDRVQLEQVLLNLVMNGCDAMARAPVSDRQLTMVTSRRGSDHVQVCVSDRGPGIRPDELERVFEPFYTTKAGGLGLGLVVSRKIVNAHGGSLRAEINSYGGATFCFTVPTRSGERS